MFIFFYKWSQERVLGTIDWAYSGSFIGKLIVDESKFGLFEFKSHVLFYWGVLDTVY